MKYNKITAKQFPLLILLLLTGFDTFALTSKSELHRRKLEGRPLFTIPVRDHYGIIAELRGKLHCPLSKGADGKWQKSKCKQVLTLSVPNWTSHTRYQTKYSELPIFDTIASQLDPLEITFATTKKAGETIHVLDLKNQELSKRYQFPEDDLPELPQNISSNPHIYPIIMGLRPQMLNDFNNDASNLWFWVNKLKFNDPLTEELIRVIDTPNTEENDSRWLNLKMGDHYAMSIQLDDSNMPTSVLIDDQQGRYLRATLEAVDTVALVGNSVEVVGHSFKIRHYYKELCKSVTWAKKESLYLVHNVLEEAEHLGHLCWSIAERTPSLMPPENGKKQKFLPGNSTTLPQENQQNNSCHLSDSPISSNTTIQCSPSPSQSWSNWLYESLPSPPLWFAFIPFYAFTVLDTYNGVSTGAEFVTEWKDGGWKRILNTVSVTVAIYNIAKSLQPNMIFERHGNRINEAKKWNHTEDYNKYKDDHF